MKLSSSTEWLFFHLWKKNPEKNNSSCPGIFIPDTIIYRWGKPFFWYFTTRDGQILRKTKERIFVENFEEIFNLNNASSDLIGMSLTSSEVQEKDGQQREKIEFEYYDKSNFKDYIFQREKTFGILQKFIEPKGHKNQIIKATWSPQFCLLSRKTNLNDLRNAKIPLNNRVATFEGSEYLTESDSITSPILSSDIEQLCINIVKHIQDVSGGNILISRMVLFFKLDDKNRIWLQYCTNIKVREKYVTYDHEEPILNQNNGNKISSPLLKISQKKQVDTKTQNIQKKVQLNDQGYVTQLRYVNDKVCANCEKQEELYDIKFNQIIESFENDILDEETKVIREKVKKDEEDDKNPAIVLQKKRQKELKEQQLYYNFEEEEQDYYNKQSLNIPGLILKLWGKISEETYQSLKQNISWLQLPTKVCDECYLLFTQVMIENKNERESKKQQNKLKDFYKQVEPELFQIQHKDSINNKNLNRNMTGDITPSETSKMQRSASQTPLNKQIKKTNSRNN
ncbi:hypothetical protein PPERSA_07226 [Pseudocohnilembus persalinus]|uniref:Uncharacterized protein n=1 Tax=Pseudocohnilembus persalinus TaxID=266149 RepID=A0A0V0QD32_PSEPJ|nr:hypothetical protein PPERSA_07226 [Pseudocohnilembus persalinus]|eukprot:KRX00119.1 hypothetical protein PPERSA_07226 [Pseudocohnilembus persalinus]